MYVAAFDGGGTKTHCLIGDEKGNILAQAAGGSSNHQLCGVKQTSEVVGSLYKKALQKSGLANGDISLAVLGLSGADLPEDYELLENILKPVFADVKYKIVNDAWIIMRSGTEDKWGAVCICGTGSNAGAVNFKGGRSILRALGYTLGNYGGGADMTKEALHHAFKADEGIGAKTCLTEKLPQLFNKKNMLELLRLFYPRAERETEIQMSKIPELVFELAGSGDVVSQDILIRIGKELGEMTAGVICNVNMQNEIIPVILGGSIFKGSNPLLIDAMQLSLHRKVPSAYLVHSDLPPVAGAYLMALDDLGIKLKHKINIKKF